VERGERSQHAALRLASGSLRHQRRHRRTAHEAEHVRGDCRVDDPGRPCQAIQREGHGGRQQPRERHPLRRSPRQHDAKQPALREDEHQPVGEQRPAGLPRTPAELELHDQGPRGRKDELRQVGQHDHRRQWPDTAQTRQMPDRSERGQPVPG
ncbi:MAG: hypothetical protein ACK55I_17145, partial [bacterium]